MSLQDVVNISISVQARTASIPNFGTPLFACYHKAWTDITRTYQSTSAMIADGFHTDDPAYKMASVAFDQDPSVTSIKIGRRASAFTQVIDLTPQTPTLGRIYGVNVDTAVYPAPSPTVQNSIYTADSDDTEASVCEQFAAAINTARTADADSYVYSGDSQPAAGGIIASGGVSSASPQTITSFNGLVGGAVMSIPRSINFIFSSSANWNSAGPIVVTGLNSRGASVTENIPVPASGGATVHGVRQFKQITSVAIPAQGGSGGTYTMGINARTLAETRDAILETGASTTGTQALTGTSLDGAIGTLPIPFGRVLTFTTNNHADWSGNVVTIKGTDRYGNSITDTFTVPGGGGTTVTGTKVFGAVTEIDLLAQGGTHGTFVVGFASRMTAVGSSTLVTVTTRTPGVVLTYDSWVNTNGGTDTVTLFDATTDPGIAADLAAILQADNQWYGLALDSNSQAEALAAAAWTEPNTLVFCAQTADGAAWSSSSTSDLPATVKVFSYARTHVDYHPSIGENYMGAAIMGNVFPNDPGSDTWAFKTLSGILVYAITETQQNVLWGKNCGTYQNISNLDITQNGLDGAGEYMDNIRLTDWTKASIQQRILTLLANSKKLPFTDPSGDILAGEILAVLNEGVANNGYVKGSCKAAFPPVATVAPGNKAIRFFPGGTFQAEFANAIQAVGIQGTLSN